MLSPSKFIGLKITISALLPIQSNTPKISGCVYSYQCEANSEEEMFQQLIVLYQAWEKDKQLALNHAGLMAYVSAEHVMNEMELILDDVA